MSEESRYLSESEEAEEGLPAPRQLLPGAHEFEMSCRTSQEQTSKVKSEVAALTSGLKCLRAKETHLTEELSGLLGQWMEFNQQLQVRVGARDMETSCGTSQEQTSKLNSEVAALTSGLMFLRAKETRLTEELSGLLDQWMEFNQQLQVMAVTDVKAEKTRLQELKTLQEELVQCWNLLLDKKSVREKNGTYMRKLEEEYKNTTAVLALIESPREKPNEENKILKTTVKDLEDRLEEAEEVIMCNDELIKQNRELASKQSVIEEKTILTAEMKSSLLDLKDQLGMKQEEEMLAGTENVREESGKTENTEHLDSPEEQRAESLLETPAAESQTGPLWRRYAKGLGIAAVGIGLITWAFWSTR